MTRRCLYVLIDHSAAILPDDYSTSIRLISNWLRSVVNDGGACDSTRQYCVLSRPVQSIILHGVVVVDDVFNLFVGCDSDRNDTT